MKKTLLTIIAAAACLVIALTFLGCNKTDPSEIDAFYKKMIEANSVTAETKMTMSHDGLSMTSINITEYDGDKIHTRAWMEGEEDDVDEQYAQIFEAEELIRTYEKEDGVWTMTEEPFDDIYRSFTLGQYDLVFKSENYEYNSATKKFEYKKTDGKVIIENAEYTYLTIEFKGTTCIISMAGETEFASFEATATLKNVGKTTVSLPTVG
ncbi:MAG: hypothetical protein ACOYIN_00715 [Christensenellales bacterium]|jgi:uncharacterized protein YxeA|nr:hypothetical protein [Eubacteriales bacterium]